MVHLSGEQQNNRSSNYARRNRLLDKVVLLVGDDVGSVQRLVGALAEKGADIALLCPELPAAEIRPLRERVESAGQRFLLIKEDARNLPSHNRVVEVVKSRMGHLDIFIDLSAKARDVTKRWEWHNDSKQPAEARWSLAHVALEEILAPDRGDHRAWAPSMKGD